MIGINKYRFQIHLNGLYNLNLVLLLISVIILANYKIQFFFILFNQIKYKKLVGINL